jgi:transcription termination factor Rho
MAAKSSSTTDKPRRRTTRKTAVKSDAESVVDEKPAKAATKKPRKTKKAVKEPVVDSEPSAEVQVESPKVSQPVSEKMEGGDEGAPNNPPSKEGEPGPDKKRRRRRRRRRGGEGDSNTRNNTGGGGNSRGQRGGGQRGGGGGGNRRGGNSDRSRRTRPTPYTGEVVTGPIEGILELHPKGYGFIRDHKKNYSAQDSDAFVSSSFIEKHGLREGILICGEVGPGTRGQGPRLKSIESIDGRTLEEYAKVNFFDDLTAVNPNEQIKLEHGTKPVTMRVMDLVTPIGKGQRALIVAPPRTGKTMLLQDIAESVSINHPEIKLIVLLIDERPEEVTEMRRNVQGEVIASSMDREVESHVRLSQLIIERGKRLAEAGEDVFILLDSITRTARAFNKWVGNTGRTMSGGLDVKALDIPKKMFGTARRFDEGGSLTVCATALIDTGSRMDEVIFQEFKGTGNMELVLSRDLADRRIWPAIDITLSGTRREELILDPEVLDGTTLLRRSLVSLRPVEAMEQLIQTLERFPDNAEFLTRIRSIL